MTGQSGNRVVGTFCSLYQKAKKTVPCDVSHCTGECGVPVANRYAALTSAESVTVVGDDDQDNEEMPPISLCNIKKKRGSVSRIGRTSQRERRRLNKAARVETLSRAVVDEKIHGENSGDDHATSPVGVGHDISPAVEGHVDIVSTSKVVTWGSCEVVSNAPESPGSTPTKARTRPIQGVEATTYNKPEAYVNIQPPERTMIPLEFEKDSVVRLSEEFAELEELKRQRSRMPKPDGSTIARDDPILSDMERKALDNYTNHKRMCNDIPPGGCTIEQVRRSSAGVEVWADPIRDSPLEFDGADTILKVGDGYAPASLCGLWAKQALLAASVVPQWERVILTVDSGASDTVLPPSIASNVPLTHTSRVGCEYEVANGGVVVNLGERKAEMKLKEHDVGSMLMSFQVVDVHKPLLAVSRLVESGHEVRFSKKDPHILLSSGTKIPMKNNLGTYEIEVWILNPGFAGQR